ncbi:hypothetical protein C8J57DRAFT_1563930, partial [Mycena rebaudengoi]
MSPRTETLPPPPRGRRTTEAAAWARHQRRAWLGRCPRQGRGGLREDGYVRRRPPPRPLPLAVLPPSFPRPSRPFFCPLTAAFPSVPLRLFLLLRPPCWSPSLCRPSYLPRSSSLLFASAPRLPTSCPPLHHIILLINLSLIFMPTYIPSRTTSSAPIPVAARVFFFDLSSPRLSSLLLVLPSFLTSPALVHPFRSSHSTPPSSSPPPSSPPLPPPFNSYYISAAVPGVRASSLARLRHPIPTHPVLPFTPLFRLFYSSFSFHTHLSPFHLPHVRHLSCSAPSLFHLRLLPSRSLLFSLHLSAPTDRAHGRHCG